MGRLKLILSRKGLDSAAGGVPSPIIVGRPISLPIPVAARSTTAYDGLGLGDVVERVTRGRISGSHLCHEDPMLESGRCAFGQPSSREDRHPFRVSFKGCAPLLRVVARGQLVADIGDRPEARAWLTAVLEEMG